MLVYDGNSPLEVGEIYAAEMAWDATLQAWWPTRGVWAHTNQGVRLEIVNLAELALTGPSTADAKLWECIGATAPLPAGHLCFAFEVVDAQSWTYPSQGTTRTVWKASVLMACQPGAG